MLGKLNADFAAWSAFSLPVIPMWLGIQQKTTKDYRAHEAHILYWPNTLPQSWTCVMLCYTGWLSHRQHCTSTASSHQHN